MLEKKQDIKILKRKPDFCGFLSLVSKLEIKSAVGRKLFSNQLFSTDKKFIINELDNTEKIISILANQTLSEKISELQQLFSEILDIEKTLDNLAQKQILNDIELFEIKKFAMLSVKIGKLAFSLKVPFTFCPLPFAKVIEILDPESSSLPTFYIYSIYSKKLSELRKMQKTENNADLQIEILQLEQAIREDLSKKLADYAENLQNSLKEIAYLDLLFAKADFSLKNNFCKPKIVANHTIYYKIFNPEIKNELEKSGKNYQKISIDFGRFPTLITGINMGGKTLMLKTLALCQMLVQYGFYVPAESAEIMPVEKIMYSFSDEQNQQQGLSSFAAEMKKIDEIIMQISDNQNVLVLIDELARTTNPKEGSAVVSAMLEILQENNVCSFITTHYDIKTDCRRLRVKGFLETSQLLQNNTFFIDYQLVSDNSGETPNEAVRIMEMLSTNKKLIKKIKNYLILSE
ncbi:MAG: DNA mismatch repair protein MutS [Prevotellaceae bacterium]|nr:DNA mismatch repair protein MutS [Prevotellaceae bacterium]